MQHTVHLQAAYAGKVQGEMTYPLSTANALIQMMCALQI